MVNTKYFSLFTFPVKVIGFQIANIRVPVTIVTSFNQE